MRVAVSAYVLTILPNETHALAWLLTVLCGCDAATTTEPPVTPLFQNIVNGVPTAQHPAVVQLQMHLEGGERMRCSGSLVGSDRVLTAAHCLPDYFWIADRPRKLLKVEVYFGSDASQPAVADGWPLLRAASHWERGPLRDHGRVSPLSARAHPGCTVSALANADGCRCADRARRGLCA